MKEKRYYLKNEDYYIQPNMTHQPVIDWQKLKEKNVYFDSHNGNYYQQLKYNYERREKQ